MVRLCGWGLMKSIPSVTAYDCIVFSVDFFRPVWYFASGSEWSKKRRSIAYSEVVLCGVIFYVNANIGDSIVWIDADVYWRVVYICSAGWFSSSSITGCRSIPSNSAKMECKGYFLFIWKSARRIREWHLLMEHKLWWASGHLRFQENVLPQNGGEDPYLSCCQANRWRHIQTHRIRELVWIACVPCDTIDGEG